MAIVGSLDSGLRGGHTILYIKSIMDGISALLFVSSMGAGVVLAAIPVLLYKGVINIVEPYLDTILITEVSAVEGILLIGLGLFILEIKKIKIVNPLPSVAIPILIIAIL